MHYVKTYYKFSYVLLRFFFFCFVSFQVGHGELTKYHQNKEQEKKKMKSWTVDVQSGAGYTIPFVAKRKKNT